MIRKTMTVVAFLVLATSAFAAEFRLKEGVSGIFDWTDGNNYEGGAAPTKEAEPVHEVTVPSGVTVVISNEMPNASLALIDSLSRIRPCTNSCVTFAVERGRALELGCAVNWQGEQLGALGTLVKEGEGRLFLTADGRYKYGVHHGDYYTALEVRSGELILSQNSVTYQDEDVRYVSVMVASNAVWCPARSCKNIYVVGALSGAGTVSNDSATVQWMYLDGALPEPCVFSGRFCGNNLSVGGKGANYYLAGTNSANHGSFDINGKDAVFGIAKFGMVGEPSSIGLTDGGGTIVSRLGFRLINLGIEKQTTDKTLNMVAPATATMPTILDAGAFGGVTFTGEWKGGNLQKLIVLDGSNTEECVVQGKVARTGNASSPTGGYSFHVTKKGSGTWRFADNVDRTMSGVLAVEDGTLKFDSIKEQGTVCSLGMSLDLYVPKYGVLTESDQVGYAFLLGDGTEAHEGNFEYVGSSSALCTTRPLALNGKGRLTNGSAHGFNFADVYAVGASTNVLTLAGDDVSADNVLSGINDEKDASGGPISIVKEGEGTWKLTGDLSLRGSIAVKKGTLVIQNNYTWYKWVVKSCYQEALGKSDIQINLGEFGLYDAAGVRQNLNMTASRADGGGNPEYPTLQPGHIDYGLTATDQFKPQSTDYAKYPRNLAKLVDDVITTGQISFWYQTKPDSDYYKEKTGGQSTYRNVPHNEPNQDTTWLPIVMRLKDDAMPIAYYDYATASANLREAYRTVLYGSVDGTNWEALESEDQCRVPVAAQWSFAQRAMVDGADAVHTNAQGQVDGRAIASVPAAYRAGYLTGVDSYSVSSGATLKMRCNAQIRGLTIDCSGAGAGTIDGATFAANGTIDVTGLAKGVREASLKFNLVNASGFANVADWTLKENGVPTTKLSVSVSEDGTVTIRRNGLMLIVR